MEKITLSQVMIIKGICGMCYFPSNSIKKQFYKRVCDSVGASKLEEIDSNDFGTAYLTAEAMLHREGERVFSTKVNSDYKWLFNRNSRKAA